MNCLSLFLALSMHLGLEGEYNSIHPHARCDLDNTITGAYYNSEKNISLYLGKKYLVEDVELELGLVTGYSGFDIAPMIRLKKDNWFIAPAYEKTGNVGVVFGYEIKIR
tara:strand:- start:216 stop:542 length:327 start_codon:yes stop_codon:yes gene_type:complete